MSKDNQFTATGPSIVAFQTDGANIDRGAEIHGNEVGVRGFCDGAFGDGVQGFGKGYWSGVAGYGGGDANSAGYGASGFGGTQTGLRFAPLQGPGVKGVGGGGPNTAPASGVGVFGQGGPESPGVVGQAGSVVADGVQGFGAGTFSGAAGFGGADANGGSGTGVFGLGGGTSGQGVRGIGAGGPNTAPSNGAVGVYGQAGDNTDGVQGVATGLSGAGVHGISKDDQGNGVIGDANLGAQAFAIWGRSSSGFAGFFQGQVFVQGDLTVTGKKAAAVPFPDGSHRRLHCVEAPQSWFEDFGSSQLSNGRAEIKIDPDFAAVVHCDDYHVFITEYEDNDALYVAKRTHKGFEVRANGSACNSTFSFRIVARRKDIQGERFEKVQLPSEKTKISSSANINPVASDTARPVAISLSSSSAPAKSP